MGKLGNLYVIRAGDTGYYKIGITKNDVLLRLKQLQTGNHVKLEVVRCYQVNDMEADEAMIYQRFAHRRVNGEWYELDSLTDIDVMLCATNIIDGYVLRQTGIKATSQRFDFCLQILARPDLGWLGKLIMFPWSLFVPLEPIIEQVAVSSPTARQQVGEWMMSGDSDDEEIEELI